VNATAQLGFAVSVGAVGPGVALMRVTGARGLYRGVKAHHAAMLTCAGRSEWWIDGHTGLQGPGSMQLKEPGQVHKDLRRESPGAFQALIFDSDLIEASRDALDVPPRARLGVLQMEPGDPRSAPLLRLHRVALERLDSFTIESAIAGAVAAFATHLDHPVSASRRGDARLRSNVRRARDFLLENLAERITLDALAAHARTDKFHLCRAFSAEVGLPPHSFLTHARIARACILLRRGLRPSDLAPRIGFCDQSQMHRHFVRIVGLTPGQYARGA
jgi:AraC-like DNA-binding protein